MLRLQLFDPSVLRILQKHGVNDAADIQQIMKEVDKDGNGRIGELVFASPPPPPAPPWGAPQDMPPALVRSEPAA